ncbi:TetR/AcrR family transcriptional regulator [Labedella populi]|uniref:TetR/AcrR family transcriptional regulator n=1 Tax=Labedella populi TaxID=2498850 RepID=A0A444Q3S0_9MICO|nr:TetR/AcrR family transcriptional regulator [Labedella populi]RWZ58493.1 TetR/AcrR family transcriptional regulator [Labedella populi]
MDPRQARTWSRLVEVVHEIAAEQPIDEVSVAELARRAAITRDTFYRHASGPADLLARVLRAELDELLADFSKDADSRGGGLAVFDVAERALLAHMREHRSIYRGAMSPRLVPALRDMLVDTIERSLLDLLERHSEIAPDGPAGVDRARQLRVSAAYAASGTIGAIEVWLADDEPAASDDAARAILAASPAWWFTPVE